MDIISMAQQARPNDMGQMELRRAQLTTLSSEAKRMPSSLRKFSCSCGFSSVTPLASSTAIVDEAPLLIHFASCGQTLQLERAPGCRLSGSKSEYAAPDQTAADLPYRFTARSTPGAPSMRSCIF